MRTWLPWASERADEVGGAAVGGVEGRHGEDLAADVERDAGGVDAGEGGGVGVEGDGVGDADAEFVVGAAGGDLGVGAGVDVGVDAEGDGGGLAHGGGEGGEGGEFFGALDVDLADVALEGECQLPVLLADAGEDDVGRVVAGVQRAEEFAAADDVGAGAVLGHELEDGEVVVGFDGVVDFEG